MGFEAQSFPLKRRKPRKAKAGEEEERAKVGVELRCIWHRYPKIRFEGRNVETFVLEASWVAVCRVRVKGGAASYF